MQGLIYQFRQQVCGIYAISHLATGKVYVGSARNCRTRWRGHWNALEGGRHKNRKLQAAWAKYGASAFTFSILEPVFLREYLVVREQYWMNALRTVGTSGYNLAPMAGTNRGVTRSADVRAKDAEMAVTKRQYRHTLEARQAISDGLRGRQVSTETRAKIAVGHRGLVNSPETRAKLSAALRGRTHSPETRAKMSATRRGVPIHTTESRAKMSASLKASPLARAHRVKLFAAKRGRSRSPETRAALSAALLVSPRAKLAAAARRGKPLSPESCAKMSASHKTSPLARAARARLYETRKISRTTKS